MFCRFFCIVFTIFFVFVTPILADSPVDYAPGLPVLTEIGLATLMSLELVVTTIGKRERHVDNIPAAVHIITREEIIRSGVQNIADALRLVPGINVFQMNSNMFVVASRGLAAEYSSKMTLLIDGRSCFSSSFGGVTWDTQDVFIEDIDRIEVVRGPGDAIWGSNATNGVINIVTKTARDTLGSYAQLGAATHDTSFIAARTGGIWEDDIYYRVYAKADAHGRHPTNYGTIGRDSSKKFQGSFRLDGGAIDENVWSLQGYAYIGLEDDGGKDISYESPNYLYYDLESHTQVGGGSLVGEWKKQLDNSSKLLLRSYYDRGQMRVKLYDERRDTFDVDAIVENTYENKHSFIWGMGYRGSYGSFISGTDTVSVMSVIPPYRDQHELSFFAQDEYPFAQDDFRLQTSAKIEYREFLGWAYQPSIKLLWKPLDSHVFWTGVTRATSMPSDADRYVKWEGVVSPPMYSTGASSNPSNPSDYYYPVITVFGNKALDPEVVIAYELGGRYNVSQKSAIDLAIFYNDYDNIKTEMLQEDGAYFDYDDQISRLIIPVSRENVLAGGIYGAELYGRYSPFETWQLSVGYSYLKNALKSDVLTFQEMIGLKIGEIDPEHKVFFTSWLDFANNWAWDVFVYYVEDLVAHKVPSYLRLDTRIGWIVDRNWEVEFIGQNLLEREHYEYTPILPLESTRAETTLIGRISYRY